MIWVYKQKSFYSYPLNLYNMSYYGYTEQKILIYTQNIQITIIKWVYRAQLCIIYPKHLHRPLKLGIQSIKSFSIPSSLKKQKQLALPKNGASLSWRHSSLLNTMNLLSLHKVLLIPHKEGIDSPHLSP